MPMIIWVNIGIVKTHYSDILLYLWRIEITRNLIC
jgi:hypothetical protein